MKTAQRIILELKDKISKEQAAAGISYAGNPADGLQVPMQARQSMHGLCWDIPRVRQTSVITKLDPELTVEDMIKKGLQKLAGLS